MQRPIAIATALALACAIAACGSGTSSTSGGTSSTGTSARSTATVSTLQVGGVGSVLVAANAMPLYTPNGETASTVRCTGSCTAVWVPLAPGTARPTSTSGVGALAVITRPDGSKQVALAGHPLYTFAQDGSGQVTGNGATDAFGGQRFTWHAVLVGGRVASGSAGSSSGGSGSGSGSGGSGGY
jgi:predicted lipoprotein with Yx(FWY)xxD motif